MPSFKYREGESSLFGIIKRPFVEIEIYSLRSGEWISFEKVLADTGADICLLPRFMGELLVEDITHGMYKKIRGVVPNTYLYGYIHELKIKIGEKEFVAPVFIADAEDITPILGRGKALDLFKAKFDGEMTRIEKK